MNIVNLKQIIRSLIRRKFYTTINIIGLGVGLGCAILMATYIIHEFSYDKYYSDVTLKYRLIDKDLCNTYYAMGESFIEQIPEIDEVCRFIGLGETSVKMGQEFITENMAILADSNILDFFDIEIIQGMSNGQLRDPNAILISDRMARKYFPNENPVGKEMELLFLNESDELSTFTISGVFKDFSSLSSLQTDFIGNSEKSFSILSKYLVEDPSVNIKFNFRSTWKGTLYHTFLKLHPNIDVKKVEDKCKNICAQHNFGDDKIDGEIWLQPISKMYLHSNEINTYREFLTNKIDSLKIFMGIGILILLVAIINFVLISNADNNLSISEIACRKVNGASKSQIIINSLLKSVIVAFISLIPAILFVWISIPVFNVLFEKNLQLSLFIQWQYILALLLITLVTGISAGLYLGFYISNVSPSSLFQKRFMHQGKMGQFKGSLVVVQFVVFLLLSSSFIVMLKQFKFSLNNSGLNTENILVVDIEHDNLRQNMDYIRERLMTQPGIIDCVPTSSFSFPGMDAIAVMYTRNDVDAIFQPMSFGEGVMELFGINLIEGRNFVKSDIGTSNRIINETAAKAYGVKAGDILGSFEIIGIANDFHFHSMHNKISPSMIRPLGNNFSHLLIKTNGENKLAIDNVNEILHNISPENRVDCILLDDVIGGFYKNEEKQMGTIGFFAGIALALSVLGLLGYVTLSLVKKIKEIGIRKINGANVMELIGMMNLQYVKWIVMAFIIACPITYYAMGKWLEDFAYKTTISWWVFGLSGMAALIFAMATVTLQSWRAAGRNPIEALRYE